MNDIKQQLKNILLRHEGLALAITGRELAHIFGLRDDRKIRLIIRELITDGLPVASSTESGYFIVKTRQEAGQYAQSIKNRLINDALRRRDFRRAADQYLTPAEQIRML